MSQSSPDLRGCRVLVVEDEYMIADELDSVLREAGADVLGPLSRVWEALDLVGSGERIDGAVLDIDLAGEAVWPVADALAVRHVPAVLTTGYDPEAIPREHLGLPRLQKPADARAVLRLLACTLAAGRSFGTT